MLEKNNNNIKNYHMEIKDIENNNFIYTYKIKKGINKKRRFKSFKWFKFSKNNDK